MAIVIHHIKGNEYAYDHNREGAKVISTYLGRAGGLGAVYKGTELYKTEVTQQIEQEVTQHEKSESKAEVTQHNKPESRAEVTQHNKPESRAEVTQHSRQLKTYVAKSISKDMFGKNLYHIDIINYTPEGKYVSSNSYSVHSTKERDSIIKSGGKPTVVSKKQLDDSFRTHKEPVKIKRMISMKKYLEQLEKDKKS